MRAILNKILNIHPLITLLIMLVSVALFGVISFNLFFMLKRNTDLVLEHGGQALTDGALMEYIMLLGYGLVSLCCYLLFKACEKILVEHICK